jgi:hypothetical protein
MSDVRKYAAEQGIAEEEALKKGMEEKSKEFTDEETTKKILMAEDWSACADKLKLASAVLLDDLPQAIELMASVKADDNFPDAYKDWPIFQKLRETPEFLTNYEKIYGAPFAVKQVTQTQSSSATEALPPANNSPATS